MPRVTEEHTARLQELSSLGALGKDFYTLSLFRQRSVVQWELCWDGSHLAAQRWQKQHSAVKVRVEGCSAYIYHLTATTYKYYLYF